MINARTHVLPSDSKLRTILEDIRRKEPNTIRAAVAEEALEYHGGAEAFFHDLQNCGCVCGTVGGLIYYADTQAFFDKHYEEIEELREEYEASTGEAVRIRGDLKNFYAWFAFEETAYRMAWDDLGLEI